MKALSAILLFITSHLFSQTAIDIKDYIKYKSNSFNMKIHNYDPKGLNTFFPDLQGHFILDFNNNFLVITRYYTKTNKETNRNEIKNVDYYLIEINRIKTLTLRKDRLYDGDQLNGTININAGTDEFVYFFKDQLYLDVNSFINSKNKNDFKFERVLPISINIENYDEENFAKFKKAFKHLVNLYGGNIIDDIF